MRKSSNVLAERFSQDPLKMYFQKLHPVGAGEDIAFKCIQVL